MRRTMLIRTMRQCLVLLVSSVVLITDTTAHSVWSHRKLFLAQDEAVGISGEFLVILQNGSAVDMDHVVADASTINSRSGSTLNDNSTLVHQFSSGLGGVVRTEDPLQLLALLDNPNVAYIEQNQVVYPDKVQRFPPWNVDHSDNPHKRLDYKYQYKFAGRGVNVFVLDTGVRVDHREFGGRATCGLDVFDNDSSDRCQDAFNHGTHVAGTIGGQTFGSAKQANLIAVKVLGGPNGHGTTATVMLGLDFVWKQKEQNPDRPMIANLSCGTPTSEALNQAVEKAVSAGIVVVASAGNDSRDACHQSPASATSAITVAASTKFDRKTTFSNFGSCVNMFAPGDNIRSASSKSTKATMTMSGTSMAAPLVSGVAALYLEMDPALDPEQVWNRMRDEAASGLIADTRNSPNLVISTSSLNDLTLFTSDTCESFLQPCIDDDECCTGKCRFPGRCFL